MDEVEDEVVKLQTYKILRLRLRITKIQKMSFRAKRSEAKNPVIHLWILRINPQNDKKSSVLRTAPLQRSKRMHMNLQNDTESQLCQLFKNLI